MAKQIRCFVKQILVVVLLANLCVSCGCGTVDEDEEWKNYEIVEGPVGDLYRFCIESGIEPQDYEFEVLLYLDHMNLPNPGLSYPFLRLMNSAQSEGLWSALGFHYYEFEDIPEDSGFPDSPSHGWKVRVWGASVEFCQTCYTDNGLLKLIDLRGPMDQVEFIWDPEDSVDAYVRPTLLN